MSKIYFVLMMLVISIGLMADGTPPEGTGSEIDPFQIATLDNLLWLSTTDSAWTDGYHFIQTQDIDAGDTWNWNDGAGFIPIGNSDLPFCGSYNGGNHNIDGIYIYRPDTSDIGFFGITNDAVFDAIGVTDVNITGGHLCVAGLIGADSNSQITQCYVSGIVNGDVHVGGLIGWNTSATQISNCHFTGTVSGDVNIGGLVGISWESSVISNSYADAVVNGGSQNVGGLVGHNANSSISSCYAIGSVYGNTNIGGMIGLNNGTTSINNSYYDIDDVLLNGQNLISIGALPSILFNNWFNNDFTLDISDYLTYDGEYYLIANFDDFESLLAFGQNPEHSFMLTDDIDLSEKTNFYIPFFAGSFNGNYHYIHGLNVSDLVVTSLGLFANTCGSQISALNVTDVNIHGYAWVGGIAGLHTNSTITDCYVSGYVNGNYNYIGGIVGWNLESSISRCYSDLSVTGCNQVGGLAGWNCVASISDCYSTGSVNGDWAVGGIAGVNNDNAEITNCYATSSVNGVDFTGALTGHNAGASILNSIWNLELSEQVSGIGFNESGTITDVLEKTTAEMQTMITYTDIGWDFAGETVNGDEDIWDISEETNDGFPFLSGFESHVDNDKTVIENVKLNIDNYPNPFNPVTNIHYELAQAGNAKIDIYNLKGQKVETLLDGYCEAGKYSLTWNANNLSSGIYLLSYETNTMKEMRKLILLK